MSDPQGHSILFNDHEVQPDSQLEGGRQFSENATHSDYILVQSSEPIYNEQVAKLEDLGARVIQMVGEQTCLCHFTKHNLEDIRKLPWVVYSNVYHTDLVVQARLKNVSSIQQNGGSASTDRAANAHAVRITLHHGSKQDIEEAIDQIVRKTGLPRTDIESSNEIAIRAKLTRAEMQTIARIDNIQSIEEETVFETFNDQTRVVIGANRGAPNVLGKDGAYPRKATGKGQIIAVSDGGLDLGNEAKDSSQFHPAFKDKIHKIVSVGRKAKDPDGNAKNKIGATDDGSGHGTHVAAIALGSYSGWLYGDDGKATRLVPLDGTAPGAKLYFQSIGKWVKKIGSTESKFMISQPDSTSLYSLLEEAYLGGARIHNSSWGAAVYPQADYNDYATAQDLMVRKYPDYVIVRACGNSGDDSDGKNYAKSIGGVGAAKNALIVGCSVSNRPVSRVQGGYIYNFSSTQKGNPSNVAMLSSRGPTNEDAIKPDLVAPGVAIMSAQSQSADAQKDYKDYLQSITEAQNLHLKTLGKTEMTEDESKEFLKSITPPGKGGTTLSSAFYTGTSQAAPAVAGAAACVRELLVKIGGQGPDFPSASLVKAILINTATDLKLETGQLTQGLDPRVFQSSGNRTRALDPAPNGEQGWGRLNLELAVKCLDSKMPLESKPKLFDYWEVRQGDPDPDTGSFWPKQPSDKRLRRAVIDVPKAKQGYHYDLIVHLVYNDLAKKGLQNQLSLAARDSTGALLKNDPDGPDKNTNVKHITWSNIAPGETRLGVGAERILDFTDDPGEGRQGFAVVWRLVETKTDT